MWPPCSPSKIAPAESLGKYPVVPNAKPDGSDDPAGRQKNRRVEVVLDLCKQGS